jgi:superfamily I DNA/RNA helicase
LSTAQWRDHEVDLAKANNHDRKIDTITDKAECLFAVMESSGAKDAGALRRAIDEVFAKENQRITLATGHKAKGLEWDVVLHLDPWRIPSKFAKTPSAIEQEHNLGYVIETRTKNVLLLASLEDFRNG